MKFRSVGCPGFHAGVRLLIWSFVLNDVLRERELLTLLPLAAGSRTSTERRRKTLLVSGDDADTKRLALELAAEWVAGLALDAGPLRERANARGPDSGSRQSEPSLQGPRRDSHHRRQVGVIAILPVEGLCPDPGRRRSRRSLPARPCSRTATSSSLPEGRSRKPRAASSDSTRSSPPNGHVSSPGPRRISSSSRSSSRRPARIVRSRGGLVTPTRAGLVCASAGVDHSNAAGPGTVILLPVDSDASAGAFARRSTTRAASPSRSSSRIRSAAHSARNSRRRDRRRRPRSAARPARDGRSRRLDAPLDPGRCRRRDRRRSRSSAEQGGRHSRGGRPRSGAGGRRRRDEFVIPAERDLFH